ncbi:hypothetical protein ACIA8K_34655 [Catenuloplanes sp. NPDC051500]|uniref:hypothetical protein n=1 Tax=Catenuloplanes sp. NPDC051500 TaxID=3363959 RepID=UPI00378D16F6
MPAELVRYDGHELRFTGTVLEFAVVLQPLLGLSGLVAKVVASRVEVERLRVRGGSMTVSGDVSRANPARGGRPISRASAATWNSGTPRPARGGPRTTPGGSSSAGDVTDRRPARRATAAVQVAAADLGGLEQRFDAALRAIRLEGANRHAEADRRFAAEMSRIDGAFQQEMARQAELRRQSRRSFAEAREHLRRREADRRDLGAAMSEATRLMGGRTSLAELAAFAVPVLSQAMTAVVTGQDGTAAVLDALRRPALPAGRAGRPYPA